MSPQLGRQIDEYDAGSESSSDESEAQGSRVKKEDKETLHLLQTI